ncbi:MULTISPECIES: hypothetical protein [Bacillus]|uniref:hypothetical protein n=1 Tax=Bacillus TaxID=1386 RepID=UPI00040CC502|nr:MULTISPECIES: hypothetical protein [Bacillus]QHZ45898.1 hypothetical protein M654_006005 [Bacillus sp. NSP9.1]
MKPIRPMRIEIESAEKEAEFDAWVFSKEKSQSESAKRLRKALASYTKMKDKR